MKNEYRVLVCGGRDYDNREKMFKVLDNALRTAKESGKHFILIHGDARGADKLSHEWARSRHVNDVIKYPANWDKHGRSAGPIRNRFMLTDGKPHVIVAFEGGNGTADMIQQGKKAGVPVYEVKE